MKPGGSEKLPTNVKANPWDEVFGKKAIEHARIGIETYDIGSKILEFDTIATAKEMQDLFQNENRIFLLRLHTWNRETQVLRLRLVPHNGVMWIQQECELQEQSDVEKGS